jgi:hypothetical protein
MSRRTTHRSFTVRRRPSILTILILIRAMCREQHWLGARELPWVPPLGALGVVTGAIAIGAVATSPSTTTIILTRTTVSTASKAVSSSTILSIGAMRPTAIEGPPIDLAATLANNQGVAVLVLVIARVAPELAVLEAVVRVAEPELPIDLLAEPVQARVLAEAEPARDRAAARELVRDPVVVAAEADPAPSRPVGRVVVVAAAPIVLVVISLPGAAAAALLAEVAEALPAPVAAGAAIAWVAAALVVAVAEAEGAAAADAEAVVDAGDEQFSNGTKTNEIEIKHHETIKIFVAGVCDCFVRSGGVCAAGCAGK